MIALAGMSISESRRLWSLWDMLGKYVRDFFMLSDLLLRVHRELGLPPPLVFAQSEFGGLNHAAALANPQSTALALSPPNTLAEDERASIGRILSLLDSSCKDIQIEISNDITRAKLALGRPYIDRNRIQFHIEHITERIVDELDKQSFLHVLADHVAYYRKQDLFGTVIGKKFPKAVEDLSNAGTSYALELNTACVFHLMRVMEHCVQRFGVRLKVSIDVKNETWYQIMEHVNSQIKALPGGAKSSRAQNVKKQKFSLAASRLDHVRIVWRNDVMHPKATYDAHEAFDVLMSVKAFLESIVTLV